MSYTLMQFGIPNNLIKAAESKLDELKEAHELQREMLEEEGKAARTEKQVQKAKERWTAHAQQARCLTVHNVLRLAMAAGFPTLDDADVSDVLVKIAKEGRPLGRPTRGTR